MIKVLIVDDERLVRIGVRSSFQWEDYGFTVVGEACNGEDALNKIRALNPDLMLLDIRMPKMDGIQLLQKMEEEDLSVDTIMMSCYNEFDLVRSAMKFGAKDYLLKLALSDEDMLEALERSRQRIQKHKQKKTLSVLGEGELREKFAKLVLDPATSFAELNHLIQELHVALDAENMALLVFSVDRPFDAQHMSYSVLDAHTITLLCNLLHDDLAVQRQGDAFILDKTQGLFLVCINPEMNLETLVIEIQRKAKEFFNLTLSICILDYLFCKSHLFSYVKQAAMILVEEKFLLGRGCIFNIVNIESPSKQEFPLPATEFIEEIRGLADLDKLTGKVRKLSEQMTIRKDSKGTCLLIFTELFYTIASLLHTYGGSIEGLNRHCHINLLESLQQLAFLGDAEGWFKMYVHLISDYLKICEDKWKRDEILIAIDYISKNYNLPISAQKVARIVGISEAYFSTLFKKEIGCGFNEYLTDLRMEKAKQLLEDKSIYIYEVCEYVGYSDANYFGKVFKKITGLSPEAYRKDRLSQK